MRKIFATVFTIALVALTVGAFAKDKEPANGIVWNGDKDKAVAVNIGSEPNDTRKNASGPKITSNAHSADFPGIYFIWDSKQKDNGYLKVAAEIFDTYESFTLTSKESNKYFDFVIAVQPGQEPTTDDCYVFFIPKANNNKNINMVFIGEGKLKFRDEPAPIEVNVTFFIVAPQDISHADYWNNPFHSQKVLLGQGINWDAVWAAYAKYYDQDYWGFAEFSLAVIPPGGKVDVDSVEEWRFNVPGKGGIPLSASEASAWIYTEEYDNAQGVLYFAPIVPAVPEPQPEPVVINLGFIGYYMYDGQVLNTSFYWQNLEEGDMINWEAVDEAYADWVDQGGLTPDRTEWKTSGYASFMFEDYAKIGFDAFNDGQLENYYKAYYVSPGYILPGGDDNGDDGSDDPVKHVRNKKPQHKFPEAKPGKPGKHVKPGDPPVIDDDDQGEDDNDQGDNGGGGNDEDGDNDVYDPGGGNGKGTGGGDNEQ